MKKAVVVMINLLLYSCLLNGMELEDLSKKAVENEEEHHRRMSLDLTPSNLRRTNTTSGSTARNTGRTARTPIKTTGDAESLVKVRSQLLSSRGVNRSKTTSSSTARPKIFDNEDNPDQVRVDMNGDANALSPHVLMSNSTAVVGDLQELFEMERNSLPEDARWKLLEKFNPEVYRFARMRGKSFEEAEMYAELLNAHDMKKSFLINRVNSVHEVNTGNVRAEAKEHYRKMKEKDPEKYAAIVLNTMEEIFEEADGKEKLDTAHSEILTVQGNVIKKKNNYLTVSGVFHVMHTLITLGMLGWGTANEILKNLGFGGNGTAA